VEREVEEREEERMEEVDMRSLEGEEWLLSLLLMGTIGRGQ
jgi:hypothetical protein